MFCASLVSSDSTGLLPELRVADHPQIRAHGFLAVRVVFLGIERCQVTGDLRQILLTCLHRTCHCRETRTLCLFVRCDRGGTFHFLAEVQAVAIAAGGRRYAVRTKQHLRAAVLPVLTGFTQCAGYTIDTGTPFYFCHSCSAMGTHWLSVTRSSGRPMPPLFGPQTLRRFTSRGRRLLHAVGRG